jgi:antitoxin (DNA-binding transcriptional repressor) of toxin-antitoxin stability system
MTVRLDLSDAPAGLRELVAQVTSGNDVEIADGGRVVAKLLSFEEAARRRGFGMFKGRVWVSDDFDAPLTDEELKGWGML